VGLKYGYAIRCDRIVKTNTETTLECTYDPIKENSQKQLGHIHWVAATEGSPAVATVHLYQHLFLPENPLEAGDKWLDGLNPNSLVTLTNSYVEYNMRHSVEAKASFQFERLGFFVADTTSTPTNLVFNLTVGLRESKKKLELKS